MKCTECNDARLVSVYIRTQVGKNKGYGKIGKYCINCNKVSDFEKFLIDKKLELKNKKLRDKNQEIKPNFSKKKEICEKCRGVRIDTRTIPEAIHVHFDKGQREWKVARNNPKNHCVCKNTKCRHEWYSFIETPSKPRYRVPTKTTKQKLQLILKRVPRNQLSIPKNLKKLEKLIFEEFDKQKNKIV